MKHYSKPDGTIWAFEDDGSQDSLITPDMVAVSGPLTTAYEPPSTPQVVTRRQARQALLLAGRLQDVQPTIDAIADPVQRGMVQIEWDDSLEFHRQRPTLIALATAIGMTVEDLDNLFAQAAAL